MTQEKSPRTNAAQTAAAQTIRNTILDKPCKIFPATGFDRLAICPTLRGELIAIGAQIADAGHATECDTMVAGRPTGRALSTRDVALRRIRGQ
jgi:hypothetical protein